LSSTLSTARGFHTTSLTRLSLSHSPGPSSCTLHVLHTLPALLFADPYELAHHAHTYAFHLYGPHNLELPAFALDADRSALVLDVQVPERVEQDTVLELAVPLHLRYAAPAQGGEESAFVDVTLAPPTAFWACNTSSMSPCRALSSFADLSAASSPVPSALQSYASLPVFEGRELAFHILPAASGAGLVPQTVSIPVGHLNDVAFVEFSTIAVVVLCVVYL
ncbi:hypothetical protein FA95DRAFT_1455957, partial [Auriscalpium vulgare]